MKNRTYICLVLTLLMNIALIAQNKTIDLQGEYNKIIISPHIETVFVEGDKSSIEIESISIPEEKFLYELKNKTLHIYLEGAKTTTKNKKVVYNNTKRKVPIYKGTKAKIIVRHSPVKIFSIRGEEKIEFKSLELATESKIRLYGESKTVINNVKANKLRFSIYGSSKVTINKGKVKNLKVTSYGEATFLATNLIAKEVKVTSYGDGVFKFNASEKIRVSAFGETKVLYKGAATLKKGIIIGSSTIRKID